MGQMACPFIRWRMSAQAELPRGRSLPGVRRSRAKSTWCDAGGELVVRALNPRGARRQPPTPQRAQIEPTAAFPRAPLAGLGSGSGRWEWRLPAAAVAAHSLHYTGAKSGPGDAGGGCHAAVRCWLAARPRVDFTSDQVQPTDACRCMALYGVLCPGWAAMVITAIQK